MTTDQSEQAQPEHGQQQRPEQGEQDEPQLRVPPQQFAPQQVPMRPGQNGQGTASFILGLMAIVLCFPFYFISFWLALGGLTLGIHQRGLLRRGEATNRAMTKAGIVLSIIGLVLSIGLPVIVSTVFGWSIEV